MDGEAHDLLAGLTDLWANASALFLDYHLSKETSEIMVKNQGRWAPRKDVPWTVEPRGDVHVVPALQWGPKMRKLVELFNKSIGQ